jgi:hypothetical protein
VAKKLTTVRRLLPVLPALLPVPSKLVIVADGRSVDVQDDIEDIEVRLSMDHASTLTVRVGDPDGAIWKDEALDADVRAFFRDSPPYVDEWRLWRSRKIGTVTREGDVTVLTFWDAGSAALKRVVTPLSRSASSLNWEGWVRLNASQAARDYRLTVVVPRPNSTPPRVEGEDGETTAGWSPETRKKVRVKGAPADASQLEVIDRALKVAVKLKATPKATVALVSALIVESQCRNLTGGDRDSAGALQVRVGIHGADVATSVEKSVEAFLSKGFTGRGGAIKISRENRSMTAGQVAQAVQGSAFPARYDQYAREARDNIQLWAGVTIDQWRKVTGPAGTDDGYGDTGNARPTEWRRGRPGENESALKALSRDAEGLGQRAFVAANRIVAARDQDLILAAPHLTLDMVKDPILAALPSIEPGSGTLSLQVEADQWGAPPGAVVEVTSTGGAPRTWLVQEVIASSSSDIANVVLQQPTTKIPKPPTSRAKDGEQLTGTAQQVAVKWAISKLDVRELPSGSNNGPDVAKIITDNGGSVGQPWCGYFCRGALRAAGLTPAVGMASVQWIYDTSGRGGDVFKGRTKAAQARPGDLAILYGTGTHVGLVEKVAAGKLHTIEGNTSRKDGGQGVSRKVHDFSSVVAIAQVKWPTNAPASNTSNSSRDAAVMRGGGPRQW